MIKHIKEKHFNKNIDKNLEVNSNHFIHIFLNYVDILKNIVREYFKKGFKKIKNFIVSSFLWLLGLSSVLADLPKPPDQDLANGNNDWLDVGKAVGIKGASMTIIFVGFALLTGIVVIILKAYHTAQERQDTSHFFKAVGLGLVCGALGVGLLYTAHLLIGK